MKYLQKLGKAIMLPVACLPLCGILMGKNVVVDEPEIAVQHFRDKDAFVAGRILKLIFHRIDVFSKLSYFLGIKLAFYVENTVQSSVNWNPVKLFFA